MRGEGKFYKDLEEEVRQKKRVKLLGTLKLRTRAREREIDSTFLGLARGICIRNCDEPCCNLNGEGRVSRLLGRQ